MLLEKLVLIAGQLETGNPKQDKPVGLSLIVTLLLYAVHARPYYPETNNNGPESLLSLHAQLNDRDRNFDSRLPFRRAIVTKIKIKITKTI